MTKIVIIGASVAGHSVAVNLREKNKDCFITLITEEPHPFYDRRKLIGYLCGNIKEKELFLATPDFYAAGNINFLKERKAVGVNTAKQTVYLKKEEKRESCPYDFLVICSGRKTILPDIPGINKDSVLRMDTLSDFKEVKSRLIGDTVCFLGWNRLACEIAKALASKHKEIKLIMKEAPLDPLPGEGVEVINSELVDVIGESGVQAVKLKEGKIIGACLVMVFMSLPRAAMDFLDGANIELSEDAVSVDERMRTNLDNVFACGAISAPKDFSPRLKTWDETVMESKVLVDNLIQVMGG
jgi:NAD(P)H-nitrite reductase large subunit